jgi:ribonuclease BN (tRNA processing enzyme)
VPFEVVVIGVGDTFTSRHSTSALLLQCGGFSLAIDCPDRYRSVLRAAAGTSGRSLALEAIDHFLITHLHGDHMNGLEGVAWYKHFAEHKRLKLVASPEVCGTIWDSRLVGSMSRLWNGSEFRSMGFADYFDPVVLPWDKPTAVGPFEIATYRTQHHIATTALLVTAGGVRFGYSADTAFDPTLIEFLSAADVIVHETNLGPAHTPYEQLAALPEGVRRRMHLIHFPDEMVGLPTAIPMLREGQVLRVG